MRIYIPELLPENRALVIKAGGRRVVVLKSIAGGLLHDPYFPEGMSRNEPPQPGKIYKGAFLTGGTSLFQTGEPAALDLQVVENHDAFPDQRVRNQFPSAQYYVADDDGRYVQVLNGPAIR